jgi:hypothetical protein
MTKIKLEGKIKVMLEEMKSGNGNSSVSAWTKPWDVR